MKTQFKFLITSIVLYALIFTGVFTLVTGCTKDNVVTPTLLPAGWTTVAAIGKDTTYTRAMYTGGREETFSLASTENEYLKAELISYSNGEYGIRVTNKQNCRADFNWDWTNGLQITSIIPQDDKNNIKFGQLPPKASVTYKLIGNIHIGQLKLKALSICEWKGESNWIGLDITAAILPIKFTACETHRKDDKLIVTFTIDTPEDVDTFEINFSESGATGSFKVLKTVKCDHKTKVYSIEIPAYK